MLRAYKLYMLKVQGPIHFQFQLIKIDNRDLEENLDM